MGTNLCIDLDWVLTISMKDGGVLKYFQYSEWGYVVTHLPYSHFRHYVM